MSIDDAQVAFRKARTADAICSLEYSWNMSQLDQARHMANFTFVGRKT